MENIPQLIDLQEIIFDGVIIGRGSFGKVLRATWSNNVIAVKKIYIDIQDVERELQQLSRVRHDNIIHFHGYSLQDDYIYLHMEYADGGSLHHFLHTGERKPYTLRHVYNWALQCFKAVAYLHAMTPRAVIHRDLKPLNMLLTDRCRCLKICDFGTSRHISMTMSRSRGTGAYMAPEVMSDNVYTEKCDVFSCGITLWEMLSHMEAYSEYDSSLIIIFRVYNGLRPSLNHIKFDCPNQIVTMMTDAWNANAEVRPSMMNMVNILTQYCNDNAAEDLSID